MSVETNVGAAAPATGNAEPAAQTSLPAAEPNLDTREGREQAEAQLDAKLRETYRKSQEDGDGEPKAEDGPKRGPDGKFIPRDNTPPPSGDDKAKPEAKAAEKAPVAKEKAAPEKVEKPAQAKPTAKDVDAPAHWGQKAKDKWASLTPEQRADLNDIAEQAALDRQNLSRAGQVADEFTRIVDAHKDTFARYGVQPSQGIAALLNLQRQMDTDAPGTIKRIADKYGVDLAKLAGVNADQTYDFGQPDPQMEALKAENQAIRQELQKVTGFLTHQVQQAQVHQQQRTTSVISEFAKDKPDFDQLAPDILAAIPVLRQAHPDKSHADLLQEAYTRAQWANPATRQALMDRQAREAEAARVEEATKAAAAARTATDVNVRGAMKESGPTDVDEILRASYRKSQAAA